MSDAPMTDDDRPDVDKLARDKAERDYLLAQEWVGPQWARLQSMAGDEAAAEGYLAGFAEAVRRAAEERERWVNLCRDAALLWERNEDILPDQAEAEAIVAAIRALVPADPAAGREGET